MKVVQDLKEFRFFKLTKVTQGKNTRADVIIALGE